MSRPSKEELQIALQEANRLREQDEDEHFIAKALLNLDHRVRALEHVMDAAKHYLHAGQAAREHSALIKAIEQAEKASEYIEKDDFTVRDGDDHLI